MFSSVVATSLLYINKYSKTFFKLSTLKLQIEVNTLSLYDTVFPNHTKLAQLKHKAYNVTCAKSENECKPASAKTSGMKLAFTVT